MSFEVVTSDIREAAGKIRAAGQGVTAADPSDDLSGIGSALSGSQSAGAASALATAWTARFAEWAQDAQGLHDNAVACATDYDTSDRSADQALRQAAAGLSAG